MPSGIKFSNEELIIARLSEFFEVETSWHRSLWQVGTVLSLQEVTESAAATATGQLRPEALEDFVRNALRVIQHDRSVDSLRPILTTTLNALRQAVNTKKQPEANAVFSATLSSLEQLTLRVQSNYLWRWSESLSSSPPNEDEVEVIARLVGSHLLDSGFNRAHLAGWIEGRSTQEGKSLVELLRDGQRMQHTGTVDYEFLVAFTEIPQRALEAFGEDSLSSSEFETRYAASDNSLKLGAAEGIVAAARIRVRARDPFAALEIALQWIRRYEARVRISSQEPLRYDKRVIDTTAKKVRVLPKGDLLTIKSIEKHLVFAQDAVNASVLAQIDDALALLAPHLQTTPGVSVASLWAAAEGLLGSVDTSGASVATRLAEIVACSFPRDEAHDLAYKWKELGSGPMREDLQKTRRHFTILQKFSADVLENGDPGFDNAADVAAVIRLRALLSAPETHVTRVRDYLDSTFRRLYYQRNFIMHSAKFDSVSLSRATAICPKLVAAGLDQIITAQSSYRAVSPSSLAARARNELALLGTPAQKPPITLLSD